uniref:Uncharacterized protein n=1 Tax=Anguilla anguilla TaxID=7936 RepID=A0A0E9UC91_ANGAN
MFVWQYRANETGKKKKTPLKN